MSRVSWPRYVHYSLFTLPVFRDVRTVTLLHARLASAQHDVIRGSCPAYNIDPSGHPLVDGGLGLVDETELEEQLDGATDARLEGRGDPGVRVGGVFADEDHLMPQSVGQFDLGSST